MKLKLLLTAGTAAALMLTGCGNRIPENTVFSIADLEGKVIGVQLDTVGDGYASEIKDADVVRFSKPSGAVNALREGEVDAVILDMEPAGYFSESFKDITVLDETFEPEEYAIAVAKGSPLLDSINSALDEIQKNGTLDEITANWIGDEKGDHPYTSPVSDEDENNEEQPDKPVLTIATNADFPPFEMMDGEDIVGFDVDMMRAVCDVLGMELKIENMEFDSILSAVDSGFADAAAAGLTITDERLETVDFSDPYTTSAQVILIRK